MVLVTHTALQSLMFDPEEENSSAADVAERAAAARSKNGNDCDVRIWQSFQGVIRQSVIRVNVKTG